MTLIKQWIDAAAARGGDAAYLEDAAGAGRVAVPLDPAAPVSRRG